MRKEYKEKNASYTDKNKPCAPFRPPRRCSLGEKMNLYGGWWHGNDTSVNLYFPPGKCLVVIFVYRIFLTIFIIFSW